jgi:hypothetical protein
MTKLEVNFLALVAVQAAHSIEEYLGRLWEVFAWGVFRKGLTRARVAVLCREP